MKKLTIFKNPNTEEITGAVLEYNGKFISFDETEAKELTITDYSTVTDYLTLGPNVSVGNLIIPLNRIQTIEELEEN